MRRGSGSLAISALLAAGAANLGWAQAPALPFREDWHELGLSRLNAYNSLRNQFPAGIDD